MLHDLEGAAHDDRMTSLNGALYDKGSTDPIGYIFEERPLHLQSRPNDSGRWVLACRSYTKYLEMAIRNSDLDVFVYIMKFTYWLVW